MTEALLKRGVGVILLACFATAPLRAQAVGADTGRFEREIRRYEQIDRDTPPPQRAVLFVGSSSIHAWCTLDRDFPELHVINRGFGGSEMSDVVHYADRIVLPYRPRTIVLYEGDNDLAGGKTPAQIFQAFRRFVDLVHQQLPGTRLFYISIKPSPARSRLLERMRATNALVRDYAGKDSLITYVDVFTPMLGSDGRPRRDLFGADSLHMNSAGYALWRSVLGPELVRRAAGARDSVR